MVQVKIFDSRDNSGLDRVINKFIQENPTIEVLDIKYQIDKNLIYRYNVLVIYKI